MASTRKKSLFVVILFAFCSVHGGATIRKINDLSLVESVAQYLKDLEAAEFFIQDYYRVKSSKMLENAKIKFAHAKRVLEHIGRMAIVGLSKEEITNYNTYAAQYLNGLPLAQLIPNLHQKREDLKPMYQKAEADLGVQKKKEINFQVISPSNKTEKVGPKKRVTFSPETKPE